MYTLQYIILILILLVAIGYAGRKLYLTLKHSGDKCYGCKGCDLHDELLKKQSSEHQKPTCNAKK